FAKGSYSRPDPGLSDLSGAEFMESTLSVWTIPPVSAKKIGHPAPFPIELAKRVIKLYSYVGDVVLDPFAGSGTTCAAAKVLGRHYVGIERVEEYCQLAEKRISELPLKV
ncbi:MAG TPA: site-specific DNA-methyltransferase, partial [Anaerolineaceae bacterium]